MLLAFSLRLIEFLFLLFLLVAVPTLSLLTARHQQWRRLPRPALYFSAVLSQWLLAAIGVAVILLTGTRFATLGFRRVELSAFLVWVLGLTAAALAITGLLLLLEKLGWWPPESELVYLLLPSDTREKLWCVFVVAPTAALCEEFVYRGYLLTQLAQYLPSVPWAWALSSAVFGLAHVYQGWSGMARAALLGAMLACPLIVLGSLYPAMAAHWLIDAIALAWLGPRFLRPPQPPVADASPATGSGSLC